MNIDKLKSEIIRQLEDINKLLNLKYYELFTDDETNNIEVSFHGFMTFEGFENEIEYEHFLNLEKLIKECYLYELDINKRELLVESIIESIESPGFPYNIEFKSNLVNLNEECIKAIEGFINLQKTLKQNLIDKLTEMFLAERKKDIRKLTKIIWLGQQKELAELFDQLRRKNWIKTISSKDAYYRTLATLFEVTDAKDLEGALKTYHSSSASSPITTQGVFSNISENIKI